MRKDTCQTKEVNKKKLGESESLLYIYLSFSFLSVTNVNLQPGSLRQRSTSLLLGTKCSREERVHAHQEQVPYPLGKHLAYTFVP